jgi:hypothetical protein
MEILKDGPITWIFSGIGVTILGFIGKKLFHKLKKHRERSIIQSSLNINNINTSGDKSPGYVKGNYIIKENKDD